MILAYTFFIPYIFKIYNGFSFYIYTYTFFIPYYKDRFWLGLQNRIGFRPNKPKQ